MRAKSLLMSKLNLLSNIKRTSKLTNLSVVFVHGLMGHRINTWTYHSKKVESKQSGLFKLILSKLAGENTLQKPQNVFWPADLLPGVLPEARIISYGYDANVIETFQSVSQNSLYAISRELINDIQLIRQAEKQV